MSVGSGWLLDRQHQLLLRATMGHRTQAIAAYRTWRQSVDLDDVDQAAYRLLPCLLRIAQDADVAEPDLPRIQGVAKRTWLTNMLRTRALGEALAAFQQEGIKTLLLKSAALFARFPDLTTVRGTGDYDVLVPRREARRAAGLLISRGFLSDGIRIDRFTEADFDTIHGSQFYQGFGEQNIDLHWRPLPLCDERYIGELFDRSETAVLAGRNVRIPSLADHLVLACGRIDLNDSRELLQRAVEAGFLLRGCGGKLDWDEFIALTRQLDCCAKAYWLLNLVRNDADAPIPHEVLATLSRAQGALGVWSRLEQALKVTVARPRRVVAAAVAQAWRSVWNRPAAQWWRTIGTSSRALERIWYAWSRRDIVFEGAWPVFLEGFSFPEADGRWTNGRLAVLSIPVQAPASHLAVRITTIPFVPPGARAFRFAVCTGPGATTRCVIDPGQGIPARIELAEARVLPSPARVLLVFRLIDPAAPAFFGLSADPRLLGLRLLKLELVHSDGATETFDLSVSPPATLGGRV